MKNWENNYGPSDRGCIPNFKHDYEEKTVKTYGGIGGSACLKKIMDIKWNSPDVFLSAI